MNIDTTNNLGEARIEAINDEGEASASCRSVTNVFGQIRSFTAPTGRYLLSTA